MGKREWLGFSLLAAAIVCVGWIRVQGVHMTEGEILFSFWSWIAGAVFAVLLSALILGGRRG